MSRETLWCVEHGDCLEVLRRLPDACADAVVTDPPAGIGFMGKKWDRMKADGMTELQAFQEFIREVFVEVHRVLKPGGHAVVWALPRTSHHTAMGLERAGFDIRDNGTYLFHVFGSGFPKSHNVALSIDKAAGHANRGRAIPTASSYQACDTERENKLTSNPVEDYAAKTEAAKPWTGFGTSLKPAYEIWILARKPLDGTVAENVLKYGTGALNIDGCRIEGDRWPAHLVFDEGAAAMLDEQNAGASRFFYVPKANKRDKDEGLDTFTEKTPGEKTEREEGSIGISPYAGSRGPSRNVHPTVKPTELMRYLVRLVTPPGGVVLDPFMGSGSTGKAALLEGFSFVGIEREAEYVEIATARLRHAEANRSPIEGDR